MTIELIAIIALAGLMIGLFRWLKQDMRDLINRMDTLINRMDTQNNRVDSLGNALGEIRDRLSHLEGLIEGFFRSRPTMPPPDTTNEQNQAA